jgi:hypothetical protein
MGMRARGRAKCGGVMRSEKNESEECRAYVVRREDQKEWWSKAAGGDDVAKICMSAATHFMKAMPNEPSGCACCDVLFSSRDVPQAFIILIPAEPHPGNVRAHAMPVCVECNNHEDRWLIDHGPKRKASLAFTPARPIHQ